MRGDRGVSPVIGVVLMVAVTTLIAATAGSFFLGLGQETEEPAPKVAKSDGELLVNGKYDDQVVSITHRGGDPVTVSNLEIQVSFSEHSEQSRLTGAPTNDIDPPDFEGDKIWDESVTGIRDALASNEAAGSDDEWSTGESITFRIAKGDVTINSGETVTVTIVHEPSGKILFESEFVATASSLDPASAGASTAFERSSTSGRFSTTAAVLPAVGGSAMPQSTVVPATVSRSNIAAKPRR